MKKQMTKFKIKPDDGRSKDWMDVEFYATQKALGKAMDAIKCDYPDPECVKGNGTIGACFMPPEEGFKCGTGQCAGRLLFQVGAPLEVIVHESTHAASFYAADTVAWNKKRGGYKKEREPEIAESMHHEEIQAYVCGWIVRQIVKKGGKYLGFSVKGKIGI